MQTVANPPAQQAAPATGVLPSTGAGSLLNTLAAGGVLLLLAGVLTLVLQRRTARD